MRDSLVIIPTYNEKENVVKMLEDRDGARVSVRCAYC